jgi:predicted phosphoribosyltransferase
MRYDDLRSGGRALAAALDHYRAMKGALALGIVRGGVPLAWEVSPRR